ncbi:N-6 DNA methylase [Candidatus Collierbacteria bacterium]|nr:N-6 DNA methylase [Candidatus Collierbacteria bacterium]
MEFIKSYFNSLHQTFRHGDAREESYYSDLKILIEDLGKHFKKELSVTTLPKKTDAGNPDFRVWGKNGQIIGYIEAKDPKIDPLWQLDASEQIKRYKSTFPNVILTNFFEFRLFRNGELVGHVKIGEPKIMLDTRISPAFGFVDDFISLINQFFSFSIPETKTAKTLAIELAKRTHFLRNQVISEELKENRVEGTQTLEGYYKAFKDHLISSLTLEEFSNLFAQTITYGLFVARSRANDNFNRGLAYQYIPTTVGILKKVFRFISSSELPKTMEWVIDDIAEVLANSNVRQIIENYYKEGRGKDPIIHFYETFLGAYDPKEREKRGVYYTPEPVVEYIVRSIHKLLKEKFGKTDGFASQSVTVLDPAAGTLTFPAEAIRLAIEEYKRKYGDGGVNGLIKNHILKNFYAFELMMASYAIGHLKIGFVLNEYGYKLSDNERFNLFLTNTLDFNKEDPNVLPGIIEREIAKESIEALRVKEEIPVMVIMGNPPYSVSSTNVIKEGSEFKKFYETYKENVRKEERNIQPLSDDYIKFIAFAHWKIKQAGKGIVGMITNNSYLDGLIHRDMRKKLLDDFGEIYILNLHGSTKRQEKTPDGKSDENVFDIQQGVSIILLIKNESQKSLVKYADIWGSRESKYNYLKKNDIYDTRWENIISQEPHNFFTIKNFEWFELYERFISLEKIFKQFNAGIATGKDNLLVSFSKDDLISRLSIAEKSLFNISMQSYKVSQVLADRLFEQLNKLKVGNSVMPYSYRPFDSRYTIYDKQILQRARDIIMGSFLKSNLGLVTTKQLSTEEFRHAWVTETISDRCLISLQTREVSYVFPLYLYNDSKQQDLFDSEKKYQNIQWENLPISCSTLQGFTSRATGNFIPPAEQIFYYIYAILYSDIYRQKYKEFLKINFPRIPFTKNYELFKLLVELGEQLVKLHLLKSKELEYPIAKYYGEGVGNVEKLEYVEDRKRVYINKTQYFEGIKPNLWNYYIGGYHVIDKWLKDRKGRYLSAEDIRHYCRMVTAFSRTIEVQERIDKLYLRVEKSLN